MEYAIKFYNDVIQYFETNYINLAFILLFFISGFLIVNLLKRRIRRRLIRKSPNHITAKFISQIFGFVLKFIVVFITLYLLGLASFTNKILAGAGLLAFVIGFALKDIGENFLAGVILAFKSPFELDDLIEVNGIEGFVKDINIRETLLKTPDGKDVFVPNSIILKNPLFNYTIDGFLRYEFTVGIAYKNNPTEVLRLVLETVNNVTGVLKGDKKPTITIHELAANSININVKFWVDTFVSSKRYVHHSIRSQVLNDVVATLVTHGIMLPASVIEVKNHEPSGLLHLKVESSE